MSSVAVASTSSISLVESSAEDHKLSDINSHNSTTHGLCFVCRHLDFEHVGFHRSSEYSSNTYSFRREFPALLNSSSKCAFCKKLVDVINGWIAQNKGGQEPSFDVSRCHIEVSLETDWHEVFQRRDEDICPAADMKAYSDRIRVHCSIPRFGSGNESGQSQFLTFFFQRHEGPHAPDLPDFRLNSINYPTAPGRIAPYSGRRRPLVADLALFKRWKQLCQEVHGTKCSQIFKGTQKIRPRVIDVDQRRLTFAHEDDRWVCLSYVWGKAQTLRLLKDNLQTFSTPGSLGPNILPNIAEDALQVTKGLGERYLWIDSLCIIQDDAQDKAKFISKMDSIYTLATAVIIASTCTDANSHLPGVRPGSRNLEPEPFQIGNATLIGSLDPVLGVKVDLRTGRAQGYLGETIWDTRAWTLQERFLAARCLVFTAEQVFWECEEAFWCEDSFREIPSVSPDPHRTSLCGGELNLSWNSDVPTFDHFYRVLLEEYSGRALTFDHDGLNAFHGIIQAFERSMEEAFFWGMPSAFLESALAWGHRSHKLRRRQGLQASGISTGDNNQFPSWSWVGWTSDGQTKLANQPLTTESLGIRFYRVAENGKSLVELKQATQFNDTVDLLSDGSKISDRTSRPYKVSLDDLSADTSANLQSVLCFWSASAHLEVTSWSASGDSASDSQEIALSQGPDSTTHVSWAHLASSLKQGDKVEVIAVAQNRGSWDSGHIANGAIGVMVISWDAGGATAIREGFAWMAIRAWTALKDRKWKLIILR
ncbi:hypothetical protein BDBG_09396 [Blastomyces gilchristii SLH14081]|uniref:Heterokaryon incompatibility domain-containing protein n=1 Tax=Blastomyces gilchristii (strain SLH14081) TaxID=559298 RepID=A0A179V4F6_BLAGS|nr:uncharacterized protein BDBG_09396 [Blastomyces gilchristii SLH14081]OAT14339.1 hypothetical protein BDBG_09396 [Blastomyces gilchristii SLH14081]